MKEERGLTMGRDGASVGLSALIDTSTVTPFHHFDNVIYPSGNCDSRVLCRASVAHMIYTC
jgi:hypothetical protein